jgi:hypothetical protein
MSADIGEARRTMARRELGPAQLGNFHHRRLSSTFGYRALHHSARPKRSLGVRAGRQVLRAKSGPYSQQPTK